MRHSDLETTHSLTACHECDLLIEKVAVPFGYTAKCPRCRCVLFQPQRNSVQKCMALAVSGLMIFLPAILLPILTLNLLGNSQQDTMVSGIVALYQEGFWGVSLLVLLCSIIIPLSKLVLVLFVTICLSLRRYPYNLAKSFRTYHYLDTWGMLEVYLLGILVSLVKLADLAEIIPGIGLYSFVALLLVTVMISSAMDEDLFWELIEQGADDS